MLARDDGDEEALGVGLGELGEEEDYERENVVTDHLLENAHALGGGGGGGRGLSGDIRSLPSSSSEGSLPSIASEPSSPSIKSKRAHISKIWARGSSRLSTHLDKSKLAGRESLCYRIIDNFVYRERIKKGQLKEQHLIRILGKWFMCVLVGMVIGICTFTIKELVGFLTDGKLEIVHRFLTPEYSPMVPFLIFFCFNLLYTLLASIPPVFIQPLSGGSGLPEVKAFLNGIQMPKAFNFVTLLGKLFSIIFSFSSGLALGPEGPMVHIATMVAAGLSSGRSKTLKFDLRMFLSFRNQNDKRDFITIGTAAGMAAAFGAPVGGVLFALEEFASFWTKTLALRTFFCCMVATFTVNILLNVRNLNDGATDYGLLTLDLSGGLTYRRAELVAFSFIGVTAGLLGPLFVHLNTKLTNFRVRVLHTKRHWKLLELVALVLVTSLFSFWLPALFNCYDIPAGSQAALNNPPLFVSYSHCKPNQYNEMASLIFNNPESTLRLLFGNMTIPYNASSSIPIINGIPLQSLPFSFPCLVLFIIIYFSLMTVTSGVSVACGLFVPNMLLGGAIGRFIGETVTISFPDTQIDSSIYAMIGAAAFVAGSLRLAISICVIIVELTGMTSYLLPLILTTMIAKWIGDFFTEGIYEHLMEIKHLPFLSPAPPPATLSLSLGDVMARPVVCFKMSERVGTIMRYLNGTTHNGFPIIDDEHYLQGLITRDQLLHLLHMKYWSMHPDELPPVDHDRFSFLLGGEPPPLKTVEMVPGDDRMFIDLHPYMNISVVRAGCRDSFVEGYIKFTVMGLRHMVIINKKNMVVGMVTRKDLLV